MANNYGAIADAVSSLAGLIADITEVIGDGDGKDNISDSLAKKYEKVLDRIEKATPAEGRTGAKVIEALERMAEQLEAASNSEALTAAQQERAASDADDIRNAIGLFDETTAYRFSDALPASDAKRLAKAIGAARDAVKKRK